MKAIIIGATGATGKDLIEVLLKDGDYKQVVTFVRRLTGITHPKLLEIVTDFDRLEDIAQQITGDVLFSCLGTTLKVAGTKERQRHIDLEIPLKFAGIARENGVGKLVLLSAYGAAASSKVFYSKIKGELEDQMDVLDFDQFTVFRPGLLLRSDTDRIGERISAGVLKLLNSLGILKKFRPLPTKTLAEKLAKAPKVPDSGKNIVALEEVFSF